MGLGVIGLTNDHVSWRLPVDTDRVPTPPRRREDGTDRRSSAAQLAVGGHYVTASTGGGKSHLASAIGFALVETGRRVLFARTTDLVQRLQVARRELGLEAAINRLDRFELLILDSC